MNIEDNIGYLASLVILLEYHEKLGAARNKWIVAEFNARNEALITALKEKHDETRKGGSLERSVDETGTDQPGSEPRRGITTR